MTTTTDTPKVEEPAAPPTPYEEPIDFPGWHGVVHRPECNCASAAWTRSWVFWGAGVIAFANFVIEFFVSDEPRMVWAIAPLMLLMTWSFGQDQRSIFGARWWRKPRVYAWILTVLMMVTMFPLLIAAMVEDYRTKNEPSITLDREQYMPATDLPEGAWVPKDRVIVIPKDDDK